MQIEDIKVYRMVHIENIEHILKNGITHRNSNNANPNYIPIGDTSLISTRDQKRVIVNNGEQSDNEKYISITLGSFTPFYFGIKMPMLYVVQQGGNFVDKAIPAGEIIYIAYSVVHIIKSGNDFYFSDGHATDNFTTFYDASKVNELPSLIDWDAVKSKYWGGSENLDLKRKKQAEMLVNGDLSKSGIVGYVCNNAVSKKRLTDLGISDSVIKVLPKAYF